MKIMIFFIFKPYSSNMEILRITPLGSLDNITEDFEITKFLGVLNYIDNVLSSNVKLIFKSINVINLLIPILKQIFPYLIINLKAKEFIINNNGNNYINNYYVIKNVFVDINYNYTFSNFNVINLIYIELEKILLKHKIIEQLENQYLNSIKLSNFLNNSDCLNLIYLRNIFLTIITNKFLDIHNETFLYGIGIKLIPKGIEEGENL